MHPIERVRSLARASWLDPVSVTAEAIDAISDAYRWMGDEVAVSIGRRLLAWHPFAAPLWYSVSEMLQAPFPEERAQELTNDLLRNTLLEKLTAALPNDGTIGVIGEGFWIRRLVKAEKNAERHARSSPRTEKTTRTFLPVYEKSSTAPKYSEEDPFCILVEAMAIGPDSVFVCAPTTIFEQNKLPIWLVAGHATVIDTHLWEKLAVLHASGKLRPSPQAKQSLWWDKDEKIAPEIEILPLSRVATVCGPNGLEPPEKTRERAFSPLPELLDLAGSTSFGKAD